MTHVMEAKALSLEKTNVSKVYANRKYNKQMMDIFQSSPQKRPLHKKSNKVSPLHKQSNNDNILTKPIPKYIQPLPLETFETLLPSSGNSSQASITELPAQRKSTSIPVKKILNLSFNEEMKRFKESFKRSFDTENDYTSSGRPIHQIDGKTVLNVHSNHSSLNNSKVETLPNEVLIRNQFFNELFAEYLYKTSTKRRRPLQISRKTVKGEILPMKKPLNKSFEAIQNVYNLSSLSKQSSIEVKTASRNSKEHIPVKKLIRKDLKIKHDINEIKKNAAETLELLHRQKNNENNPESNILNRYIDPISQRVGSLPSVSNPRMKLDLERIITTHENSLGLMRISGPDAYQSGSNACRKGPREYNRQRPLSGEKLAFLNVSLDLKKRSQPNNKVSLSVNRSLINPIQVQDYSSRLANYPVLESNNSFNASQDSISLNQVLKQINDSDEKLQNLYKQKLPNYRPLENPLDVKTYKQPAKLDQKIFKPYRKSHLTNSTFSTQEQITKKSKIFPTLAKESYLPIPKQMHFSGLVSNVPLKD